MATRDIKRRIISIKNTRKITKAMELVAAAKMRKAVALAVSSREYVYQSKKLVKRVTGAVTKTEDLEQKDAPEKQKRLLIAVSSQKGLCGSYNSRVYKKIVDFLENSESQELMVDIITVGKKNEAFLTRIGRAPLAAFSNMSESPQLEETYALSRYIQRLYATGEYQDVSLIYTEFVSVLIQETKECILLPYALDVMEEESQQDTHLFESDTPGMLDRLLAQTMEISVYQKILESKASEQSARMMAMKNANEAAKEMVDKLTLSYNKARQAAITKEIAEISAGIATS